MVHDMEKHQLLPREIVGTSMGGIIGACMAIGMKESEIYELIKSFAGVFNWIKFSFSGNAVVHNGKLAKIFDHIFKEKKTKGEISIAIAGNNPKFVLPLPGE